MIRTVAVTAALDCAFLYLALLSLRAARCNWRRSREASHRAPLDGLINGARSQPGTRRLPRRWPPPPHLSDAGEALAYASLADDTAVSRRLAAELALLTASAALGGTLPLTLHHQWASYASSIPLMIGAFAFLLREHATTYWRPLASAYRHRHHQLGDPDSRTGGAATSGRRREEAALALDAPKLESFSAPFSVANSVPQTAPDEPASTGHP